MTWRREWLRKLPKGPPRVLPVIPEMEDDDDWEPPSQKIFDSDLEEAKRAERETDLSMGRKRAKRSAM
jgi:hypothetical protein